MENTHAHELSVHAGNHKKIEFKSTFNAAWEIVKKNWKSLLYLALLGFIIQLPFMLIDYAWQTRFGDVVRGIQNLASLQEMFFYFVFQVISMIVSLVITYNVFKINLKISRGHTFNFKELYEFPKLNFLKYVFANLLYCIIVFVGFIFLIIPGIYFLIRYSFAPLLVLDKKVDILESFKKSTEMTNGHKWQLFNVLVVTFFALLGIIIVGLICLIVGVIPAAFIASWIATFSYIELYKKLSH